MPTTQKNDKKELWGYLTQAGAYIGPPWLVLGEFSSVIHMKDIIGRNSVTLEEVITLDGVVI